MLNIDRVLTSFRFSDVQFVAPHINQTFKPTAFVRDTARSKMFRWQEKDKDHGMVSVEQYYERRYGMKLK